MHVRQTCFTTRLSSFGFLCEAADVVEEGLRVVNLEEPPPPIMCVSGEGDTVNVGGSAPSDRQEGGSSNLFFPRLLVWCERSWLDSTSCNNTSNEGPTLII